MGLDALLAELTRLAQAEEDRIRGEGCAREAGILRAGDEALQARRETELARISTTEHQAVRRDTAAAERANRLAVLEARARLMDAVFARAEAELAVADGARYGAAIPALVRATLPYLEGQDPMLHCRPDVVTVVRAAGGGATEFEVRSSPDAQAGILGETRDGVVMVDNRLVALLARRREDLAIELARRLESD